MRRTLILTSKCCWFHHSGLSIPFQFRIGIPDRQDWSGDTPVLPPAVGQAWYTHGSLKKIKRLTLTNGFQLILGKERADELARVGGDNNFYGPEPGLGLAKPQAIFLCILSRMAGWCGMESLNTFLMVSRTDFVAICPALHTTSADMGPLGHFCFLR